MRKMSPTALLLVASACSPTPPAEPATTPVVSTEPPAEATSRAESEEEPEPTSASRSASVFEGDELEALSEEIRDAQRRSAEVEGGVATPPPPPPTPPPRMTAHGPFPSSNHPAMTQPKLASGKAPKKFAVRFDTTAGTFTVQCRRDWAPHGADRFYSLVAIRYFDDVAFFRAVKGFVVQFGIHGDPAVNKAWRGEHIDPDPVRESNLEGYLTFAQAGRPAGPGLTADSRSVQLFINLTDNQRLDSMGFAPICRVSRGLDVVHSLYTGHGEKAGRDQAAINAKGNPYLRQTYPDLDYIEKARMLP